MYMFVEWLNAEGYFFHRKCFKYDVLSQPWDPLWSPRTAIKRRDPSDKVGETHVCWQAGSPSKESFKLGITGKKYVNSQTNEDMEDLKIINKTGMKWAHLKCMHTNKGVVRRQHDWGTNEGRCSVGPDMYKQENWLGMWRSEVALAAVTLRWWTSGSWEEGSRQIAGSQSWNSGELTWASSGTCLKESHGIQSWREGGSRRPGWFLRMTCSKLKNYPFWFSGKQVRVAGAPHGWTRSSWQKSAIKPKNTIHVVSWPRRNTKILSMQKWDEESQSLHGVECGKWCERDWEGLLQVYWKQN